MVLRVFIFLSICVGLFAPDTQARASALCDLLLKYQNLKETVIRADNPSEFFKAYWIRPSEGIILAVVSDLTLRTYDLQTGTELRKQPIGPPSLVSLVEGSVPKNDFDRTHGILYMEGKNGTVLRMAMSPRDQLVAEPFFRLNQDSHLGEVPHRIVQLKVSRDGRRLFLEWNHDQWEDGHEGYGFGVLDTQTLKWKHLSDVVLPARNPIPLSTLLPGLVDPDSELGTLPHWKTHQFAEMSENGKWLFVGKFYQIDMKKPGDPKYLSYRLYDLDTGSSFEPKFPDQAIENMDLRVGWSLRVSDDGTLSCFSDRKHFIGFRPETGQITFRFKLKEEDWGPTVSRDLSVIFFLQKKQNSWKIVPQNLIDPTHPEFSNLALPNFGRFREDEGSLSVEGAPQNRENSFISVFKLPKD